MKLLFYRSVNNINNYNVLLLLLLLLLLLNCDNFSCSWYMYIKKQRVTGQEQFFLCFEDSYVYAMCRTKTTGV